MKKLIYILTISLFTFGCSKSDDNPSENTFLKIYEDTVWLNNEDEQSVYIRFINNIKTPIEYWIEFEDCYFYILDRLSGENKIIESTEDKLVFRYKENDDGIEYMDIVTLTITGNSIKVETEYYENGVLVETDIYFLAKSSDDVDTLILCD
jgi:hypothetical protein